MKTFFDQMRYTNIFPDGEKLLYGDKEFKRSELTFRKLGDWPDKNQSKTVTVLWFIPTLTQIKRYPQIPEFVKDLRKLKVLKISLDLLPIRPEALPDSLESLSLIPFKRKENLEDYKNHLWDRDYKLSGLRFFSYFDFDGIYEIAGISADVFPNLESIECFIDKDGLTLDYLSEFSKLHTMYLFHLRSFDIFIRLSHLGIKNLKMEGFGKNFPISNLTKFANLELLHVNGFKEEFDCEILRNLSGLREFVIFNSPRIMNIESLLELENLQSLHVMNCKKPFKKTLAKQFKEANIEFLSIDFA